MLTAGACEARFFAGGVAVRSYCAPTARAERNGFGCHFLARPKKWPRRAPRRSLLERPWCARKRRGAARPLGSSLRKGLTIQRLCLPLKAQRQTDRARIFAVSFSLKFLRTRGRSRPKKRFLFCLRASSVLVLGLPSATAKFEQTN